MSKKMLINALHAEEARVAIVEDGRLVDLDVEIAGNEQIRGNIYKGVVVRVEPGLQAAFVDVGLKKLGFLQMGELHPENWKWRDDVPEDQRHRRPRIQEVLRRGQELIVQVEKGERDNKGSALTTYASLPGRYMVLMPGSDSSGISRKVEAEGERKKLKEIISEMTIPEGYGYIIRTEAMGRSREELQKDLDSLISLYEGIKSQGGAMKGAGLIYQESALIIRTIRDYFSADIDEVLVDSKDVYRDVRECLKEIDPQFEKLVKMHQEKRPIFSRYQLEEQIDLIYEKKVPLKSGGSIFIEPTEALVSIDVNSGKSTGEKGVEDTAFKTNMEAAEEAARQLRLRDLGGLIVIDFIDMRDRKHNAEVEKTMKTALKADKARVNVSRISEFGLLEMSRQRIRQTLHQASTLECPHCDGRGKVKSVEAMALSFLRKVHAAAAKGTIGEVVGSLPLEVAYYLLNRKRHELSQIEIDYDIEVTVKGKPSYLLNQMDLELVKREKLPQEELPQERIPARAPVREEAAAPQEPVAAEGRKKKKRGKAKPQVEHEAAVVTEPVPIALAVEPGGAEGVITIEGEEEQKKKRRRKRKRGGKGLSAEAAAAAGEHPAGEAVEVAVDLPAGLPGAVPGELPAAAQAVEHAAEHAAEPVAGQLAGEEAGEQLAGEVGEQLAGEAGEEAKKKRRRKRRRGGKSHEAAPHEADSQVAEQQGGMEATQYAAMSAGGATPAEAAALEAVSPMEAGAPSPVENSAPHEKPRKGRPPRGRKPAAEPVAAAPVAAAPVIPEAAEVPAEAFAGAIPVAAEVVAPAAKAKRARGARPAAAAVSIGTAGAEPAVEVSEVVAVADAVEISDVAGTVPASEPATAAKPARGTRAAKAPKAPKAAKVPAGEVARAAEAAAVVEPVATEVEPAPAAAKPRATKQKAKPAREAEPGQPSAEPAEEQPKKARAPRRKKEETPV
ncbi:MAG: ribonuclease E [Geobacteraceae bacterium GWC2_58_44]|nr:MAG: ribonuclease E [Geobacteraceae bacterium GWC2_58_44]